MGPSYTEIEALSQGHVRSLVDEEHMFSLSSLNTSETIDTFEDRALGLINSVCADEFSPKPDFQSCKWCEYKDLCEEG